MKFFTKYSLLFLCLALFSSPFKVVSQNRIIKSVSFVKKVTIPIKFPCRNFQWYNGDIYCLNHEKQSIIKIDATNGDIKQEIGRKGKESGEFEGLYCFIADNDGLVGVDISQGTITSFDHQGKIKKLYKHPTQLLYATRLQTPSQFLVKPLEPFENNKEQFQIIDIELQTRQPLFANAQETPPDVEGMFAGFVQPKIHSVYFNGVMVKNQAGSIFRVSNYCGEFIAFDEKTGQILYGRKTIDPTAKDKTKNSNTKIPTNLKTMREINLSATANSQYLFVLSNTASPDIKDFEHNFTDERVIDVYQINNGDYAFSFVAPKYDGKRAKGLTIVKESIWLLYDNDIVQYNYQIP